MIDAVMIPVDICIKVPNNRSVLIGLYAFRYHAFSPPHILLAHLIVD